MCIILSIVRHYEVVWRQPPDFNISFDFYNPLTPRRYLCVARRSSCTRHADDALKGVTDFSFLQRGGKPPPLLIHQQRLHHHSDAVLHYGEFYVFLDSE